MQKRITVKTELQKGGIYTKTSLMAVCSGNGVVTRTADFRVVP